MSAQPLVRASRSIFSTDKIITYETDSTSDFEALRNRITKRLTAILSKETRLGGAAQVTPPLAAVMGLAAHELVALAENLDSPGGSVASYVIRKDMEKAGFTRIAFTLGIAALLRKDLLSSRDGYNEQTEQQFTVHVLTQSGLDWLVASQDKVALTTDTLPSDDVPFQQGPALLDRRPTPLTARAARRTG